MGKLCRGIAHWPLAPGVSFPFSIHDSNGDYWAGGGGTSERDMCYTGRHLVSINTDGQGIGFIRPTEDGSGAWLGSKTIPGSSATVTATGICHNDRAFCFIMQDSTGTVNDYLMWAAFDASGTLQELRRVTISINETQRYEYICFTGRTYFVLDPLSDRCVELSHTGVATRTWATRNANHVGLMWNGRHLKMLVNSDFAQGSLDTYTMDGTVIKTAEQLITVALPSFLSVDKACTWDNGHFWYNGKKFAATPPTDPDIEVENP
ncbi:MAG: hypothetical protein ACPG5Z_00355 [Pseudoalteromonas sp.]